MLAIIINISKSINRIMETVNKTFLPNEQKNTGKEIFSTGKVFCTILMVDAFFRPICILRRARVWTLHAQLLGLIFGTTGFPEHRESDPWVMHVCDALMFGTLMWDIDGGAGGVGKSPICSVPLWNFCPALQNGASTNRLMLKEHSMVFSHF